MFWFITACVAIVLLMASYNHEIATGEENKVARTLALFAVGASMGFLFVNHIAV